METIPEDKNVTLFIGPEQISNGSTPVDVITTALDVDEDLKVRVKKIKLRCFENLTESMIVTDVGDN